jgi:mannose-6-phosphate isomerase-like protein (cupin superfamily)
LIHLWSKPNAVTAERSPEGEKKKMEAMNIRPVRRIVTTQSKTGRSRILLDGPARQIMTIVNELWRTEAGRHDFENDGDLSVQSNALEPPHGGTIFRFFEIAPESATQSLTHAEKDSQAAEWFAGMGAAHLRVDTRRHPAMHRSRTTDYIVLLSGEITLLLDEDEVDLKPFDTVIQRGTNHAWRNRGGVPALLMAVLVDGGEDPKI